MSEDKQEQKVVRIQLDDCTFEQLKKIVFEMQSGLLELYKRQEKLMKVLNHNVAQFKKMVDEVNKGFKTRDEILNKLGNTQKIIIRETNHFVGEFKKMQAEHLDHILKASDRGPKLDN